MALIPGRPLSKLPQGQAQPLVSCYCIRKTGFLPLCFLLHGSLTKLSLQSPSVWPGQVKLANRSHGCFTSSRSTQVIWTSSPLKTCTRLCLSKSPPPGAPPRFPRASCWAQNLPLICEALRRGPVPLVLLVLPRGTVSVPRGPSAMSETKALYQPVSTTGPFSDAAWGQWGGEGHPWSSHSQGSFIPRPSSSLQSWPTALHSACPWPRSQPGSSRALLFIKSMRESPGKAFKQP